MYLTCTWCIWCTWCTWISGTWSNIYLFLRSFHHFLSYFWYQPLFLPYFCKTGTFLPAGLQTRDYCMMLMIIIALYLPPVISSTYCSFVLLSLSDIFDTRDNGSTGHRIWDHRFEWSIMTSNLLPVNSHLLPGTCGTCDVKNRWWHNGRQLTSKSYYFHLDSKILMGF